MKKSELIQILREYLNEDLRKIVKEELNSLLNEIVEPTPTPRRNTQSTVQPQKKTIFKGDNILSSILNETAQAHIPIVDDSQWDPNAYEEPRGISMGNAMVGATMREQLMQKMGLPTPTSTAPATVEEIIPDDRQGVPLPSELEKAFTRDYSKLVTSDAFNRRK